MATINQKDREPGREQ